MSDNVSITAGSGTTIAADNIGGVQYQRIKIGLGADGTAVDAVGGSGVDSTAVQRVSLATNVALPAGTNAIGKVDVVAGDVDHDVANTAKVIQVGGHSSPSDVPPTLVTLNRRVRGWFDRGGAQVVRQRKLRETFTAYCRLAETTARLDPTFTHVANTNKQLVTFHHPASATKEIRIQKVILRANLLGTAAGFWNVELRAITGTPATGNPAITPKAHNLAASSTEAVCLVLPTTPGTDATVDSVYGGFIIDHGIEATTQPTAHPQVSGITGAMDLVLYDSAGMGDEVLPIVLRAGILEGIAIVSRDTAAMVLRFYAIIRYTEEIV